MRTILFLATDSALLPSRIQMAFTLAYHIILVPLGVALPTLTLVMEGIGLFRHDALARKIARRWSVVMAVQFAVYGRETYSYHPDGVGRSPLFGRLSDGSLGVVASTRNWATVTALLAMSGTRTDR